MFQWHKEIDRLDIPAAKVFHLERSLSSVQVALPGLPSQEATAYLCVFSPGKGLRVALVLHLLTSRRLAFYLHDEEAVPQQEAPRLIEAGIDFAESLGFMLSDVDYRKLGTQQRAALWSSLPLKNGIEMPAPIPAVTTATREEGVIALPEESGDGRALAPLPVQFAVSADEEMAEILEEPELPEELELPLEFEESDRSDDPERPAEADEPEIPEDLDLPVEFEEPAVVEAAEQLLELEETAVPDESDLTVEIQTPAAPAVHVTVQPVAEKGVDPDGQPRSLRPPSASEFACAPAEDACDIQPQADKQPAAAVASESEAPMDSGLMQRPVVFQEVPAVRLPTSKKSPSAEDAMACRRKLLESLGRFLSSM